MTDDLSKTGLHRLIYCSLFSPEFPTERIEQDREIAQIVNVSVLKNGVSGITGLLLADHNWFLQVLEGPEERLMTCYRTIILDQRHTDIILKGRAPIAKRDFYNWGMCARRLSKADDAILETLDLKSSFSPNPLSFETSLRLLKAVRSIQWNHANDGAPV